MSKENILLCVLLSFLFFSAFWRLPHSPATWFDEGINIGIAKSLVEDGVYNLKVGPGEFVTERHFLITTNYPVLLPVALSVKLFGFNFYAARLPMAIFLILFAWCAYRFVLKLHSKKTALFSLALLLTFVPLYGNGKAVLGEVAGLFFFLAGLLLLPEARYRGRLLFVGVLFGLSIAVKPFFLLVIPAVLFGEYVSYGRTGEFWSRLSVIVPGLLLPLAFWLWTIFPEASFKTAVSAVNYYLNSYAARGFGELITSNLFRFLSETTPLHFLMLFVLSLFGLWRVKRKGGRIREAEVIIVVFVLLNLLWYLKTPGWYRYFFPAHLLLFLLFPAALLHLCNRTVATGALTGLFLFQSVFLIVKRNESLYYSDEVSQFSAAVMEHTTSGASIFVMNKPSVTFLLFDRAVYQYLQINPRLYFGRNTLTDRAGVPYEYIVADRSVGVTAIPDVEMKLALEYAQIHAMGHSVLYKFIQKTPQP